MRHVVPSFPKCSSYSTIIGERKAGLTGYLDGLPLRDNNNDPSLFSTVWADTNEIAINTDPILFLAQSDKSFKAIAHFKLRGKLVLRSQTVYKWF